ncbi:MAG: ferredoxin [Candidatus Shapirobacteria bacterium]|nr:ferredoxin [Candidatus Shapirobacteria bacterium]
MKNKNNLKFIIPIVLISSSAFVLFQIKNDLSLNQTIIPDSQNSNSINSNDETNTSIELQKLSILTNRCRGCGRCVRIDPLHFEMNNGIATVISSINLNSSNLKLAISNCPAQAITLE